MWPEQKAFANGGAEAIPIVGIFAVILISFTVMPFYFHNRYQINSLFRSSEEKKVKLTKKNKAFVSYDILILFTGAIVSFLLTSLINRPDTSFVLNFFIIYFLICIPFSFITKMSLIKEESISERTFLKSKENILTTLSMCLPNMLIPLILGNVIYVCIRY